MPYDLPSKNIRLFMRGQMAQANQARQLCREAALGGTDVFFHGQKCKLSLENGSNFELPLKLWMISCMFIPMK
jgi:hypothetical protein